MPKISKNKCCDCKKAFICFGAKRCRCCLFKSSEYRENISKAMKGRYVSPEVGKKISASKKGIPHYNQRGSKHSNYKGGKPYCLECNIKLGSYSAKRCIQCSNRLKNANPVTVEKIRLAMEKRINTWSVGRKASDDTRKKMSFAHKGNKCWLWRGGVTSENHIMRNNVEYKLWRESVFKRDDYTCQECKTRGRKLNADHIKPWALFPELRFAIDNGRTLCVPCHKKTDTYGWKTLEKIIHARMSVDQAHGVY